MAEIFPGMSQELQTRQELERYCEQLEKTLAERTRQLVEAGDFLRRETDERLRIQDNLRSLREKLETEERARIARDIHDSVGQSLQAMKLNLKLQREQCRQGSPCKCEALNGMIDELSRVSDELRDIVLALRPAFLCSTPIDEALRWLCNRMSERTGLDVRVSISGECSQLSEDIKLALFRICQEAVTNAIKYAGEDAIQVSLSCNAEVAQLTIVDHGRGGACEAPRASTGSGMMIMRERAELVGGNFAFTSLLGIGTTILVEVPLT